MATFETIDATANTAAAITRATKLHVETQATNLQTKLRLANLEKITRKDEQKADEFSKIITHNINKQKNTNRNQNQNQGRQIMVNLTSEGDNSPEPSSKSLQQSQGNQKRKQNEFLSSPPCTQRKSKLKTVHWNESELQQIHTIKPTGSQLPATPVAPPFSSATTVPVYSYTMVPFFVSAPPPVPPPAPFAGNPHTDERILLS
jgi:hypothetical protein